MPSCRVVGRLCCRAGASGHHSGLQAGMLLLSQGNLHCSRGHYIHSLPTAAHLCWDPLSNSPGSPTALKYQWDKKGEGCDAALQHTKCQAKGKAAQTPDILGHEQQTWRLRSRSMVEGSSSSSMLANTVFSNS